MSLEDAISVLILLGPGFAAIELAHLFYGSRLRRPSWDKWVYSVLVGAAISGVVFLALPGVSVKDAAERPHILFQPLAATLYVGLTVAVAYGLAWALRLDLVRLTSRKFWGQSASRVEPLDPWESLLRDAYGVVVETGSWRYYGALLSYGVNGEEKELLISCKDRRWFNAASGQEEVEAYPRLLLFPARTIHSVSVVTTKQQQALLDRQAFPRQEVPRAEALPAQPSSLQERPGATG